MYYDKRNRVALAELAPNTKQAANKWYDYLVKNKIEVLIYDARRTEAEQRANVNSGASQTMYSYHLVGQAIDFVPVKDGKALWGGYGASNIQKAIKEAQRIGFTWGGDWDSDGNQRDETFIDSPHLQFNYKGYGSDKTLSASAPSSKPTPAPSKPSAPASSSGTHKVVYGDTLSGIGKKYGVSVTDIKVWNGLKSSDIYPGDVLKVKKPAKAPAKSIVPYPGKPLYNGARGMEREDIERIQRAVKAEVTGKFDGQTTNAVKKYQARHKLKADGVVGPLAWAKMF